MELDIEIRIYDWGENNYKLHIKNEEKGDTLTYADNKDLDECLKHIEDYIHGISKGQSSVEDNNVKETSKEEIIHLFKEQSWYKEWKANFDSEFTEFNNITTYLKSEIYAKFVCNAFNWAETSGGYEYWVMIDNDWRTLLKEKGYEN